MPHLASLAGPCVPVFLQALGEAWFRLGGRGAGVLAGEADGNAQQRVFTADTLAVFLFDTDGKARILRRAVLGRQFHLLEQHRRVTLEITLDISGLIAMAAQAPDKDAEAVEIPG